MTADHEIRHGIDFTELADWAESDQATRAPQTSPVLHGEEAQRASRALLGRGRPTLGAGHATGKGESPRRQLRLDAETNQRLDAYAAQHHMSASEVMRRALANFLNSETAA
ncbi:CopG family transcriptional regulator [Luteococcus sp. H138]|uniref:CopG family transcriptional regulator n=1 Tax=unclassified Luteococcus TaxID=2639923 RepID=UPI00313C6D24